MLGPHGSLDRPIDRFASSQGIEDRKVSAFSVSFLIGIFAQVELDLAASSKFNLKVGQ